jgi:hypothetical protein
MVWISECDHGLEYFDDLIFRTKLIKAMVRNVT